MSLQEHLTDLNEELEMANQSMKTLLAMSGEVDVSFQIETITENIHRITNEIASILDAMN